MCKLLKAEWKKIFQWKFFLILLPCILLLNGILLSEQIRMDFRTEQNSAYCREQKEESSYTAFLEKIESQAERMQDSAVFNGSFFNRKSLEKTKDVYGRLYGIQPEKDYPSGLRYVTDYRVPDLFLLFCVIALLSRLTLQERAEGLFHLVKPTRNGRGRLICAKYLTLAAGTGGIAALLYMTNYLIVRASELLGPGDAAIQSVEGYLASPFPIRVHTYLLLFFLCKVFAAIAVSSIFFLLSICCRNQIYTVLSIVGVLAAEILLWITIEDFSWLAPAGQMNLAAIMDTSRYFRDYTNINFLGMPVSAPTAGLAAAFAAIGLSLLLSVKIFSREASADLKKVCWSSFLRRRRLSLGFSARLFRGESRKLFMMHRGLLLLIIIFAVQWLSYGDGQFFSDREEAYYLEYSQVLQGELSEEKENWLKAEEDRFGELEQNLEKQYRRYEKGEINAAVLEYYVSELTREQGKLSAFERARKQYSFLEEQEKKGEHVAYLYQTGWNVLLGPEGKRLDIFDFAKLFLILLLALFNMGTVEKSSCVELLILPSAKGMRDVNRVKAVLCSVYAVLTAGIVFVLRPLQIMDYYSLEGGSYSIRSLLLFAETDWTVSIGIYLSILYVAKVMIAVLVGKLIFYLSRKCSHESTVLLLGGIVLLLPIGIWLCL